MAFSSGTAPRPEWMLAGQPSVFEGLVNAFSDYPVGEIHSVVDGINPVGETLKVPNMVHRVSGAAGCSSSDTGTGDLSLTDVALVPTYVKMRRGLCYTDLRLAEGFQAGWSKIAPERLADNPDFVDFYSTFYGEGFTLDAFRYAWLGDTAAALESGGGYLRTGVAPADYSLMDGYWKQIIAAGSGIKRVTLSKNALLTTALQTAYTGAEMVAFLQNAIQILDPRAQARINRSGGYFLVPLFWFNTIKQYYESISVTATGNAQGPIVNGRPEVGGIPLVAMPLWDLYVGSPNNQGDTSTASGAALYYPNRFILVGAPSALPMGVSYDPARPALATYFDPNADKQIFRAEVGVAAKLGNTFMMSVGY